MRKVDLSGLLEEVTNFGSILGPDEYRVLTEAHLILRGQFPTDEDRKMAYLTRSAQVQAELINLLSRISYIQAIKTYERDAQFGKIIGEEEYPWRDRHALALNGNSVYRDLCEVVDTLDVIRKLADSLLWSLKDLTKKV